MVQQKNAVVINDPRLESMCVRECTNEYGVCVRIKEHFGELYVMSIYCQYGRDWNKVPKATTLRFYYRLVYYCILVR